MFPESLGGAAVGKPVFVHVCEQVVLACGLEDLGDVLVLGRGGAELVVSTVAEIGPNFGKRLVVVLQHFGFVANGGRRGTIDHGESNCCRARLKD